MTEDDDVLLKADALMRRHRVFVAGVTAPEAAATDVEDVPLLTDIVDSPAAVTSVPCIADRHHALALELENWLDAELPRHVMRVLDGITDQLIVQLSLKAKTELLPRLLDVLEASPVAVEREFAND